MTLSAREVTRIRVYWFPTGGFLIYGENENGADVDESDLAFSLFAWDPDSFYGSLCAFGEYGDHKGIYLTPIQAVRFFARPSPANAHYAFEYDESYQAAQAVGKMLHQALEEGWFSPDFRAWQEGKLVWRLQWPHQVDEAILVTLDYANAWLDAAVKAHIAHVPEVQEAWSQLLTAEPLLGSSMLEESDGVDHTSVYADESDWLTTIGWLEDTAPFRVGLQLSEPEAADEEWRLRVVLQDKQDIAQIFPFPVTEDESFPREWLSFEDRIGVRLHLVGRLLPWLEDQDSPTGLRTRMDGNEAFRFFSDASELLSEAGVLLFVPSWWAKVQSASSRMKARVKSSVGSGNHSLFGLQQTIDFDWHYAIGGLDITDKEFEQLVAQKQRLVQFRGQWIQIDPAFYEQAKALRDRVRKRRGLHLADVLERHLLAGDETEVGDAHPDNGDREAAERDLLDIELNEHLHHLVRHLHEQEQVPLRAVPSSLQGSLRPYQHRGYSWLMWLRQYGFGACLADDMGLGKTIQYIAYLLEICDRAGSTPSLLICPTSVLGNWQKELARFAPGLRVYVHYGAGRAHEAAFTEAAGQADLVLTTYTIANLDEQDLSEVEWNSICLDEAQNIKNPHTKQSQVVRRLSARHRIAMTGTPMENRLTELWSIFDFVNPSYLGSLRSFSERFVHPIERTQDGELIGQIQRLVRPFLLRRVKTDPLIELDLPDKTETKVYVSLTSEQAALYESVLQDMLTKLDTLPAMERRGTILGTLTRLKQICDHPALALKDGNTGLPYVNRSAKVERLLEMVGELRAEGDQCLIFTQFVEAGTLLQGVLAQMLSEDVLFLHGGVAKAKRDAMVEQFQAGLDAPGVFVLSLKAGGVGLNLTAANHVFHFDRWWNPAVENQATDRAFRIGQTRRVQVHKFVALGTLEERIDEMIERKFTLSEHIVGAGEQWITELSTEEIGELFALRREWVTD